jgi:hypothetical protein
MVFRCNHSAQGRARKIKWHRSTKGKQADARYRALPLYRPYKADSEARRKRPLTHFKRLIGLKQFREMTK